MNNKGLVFSTLLVTTLASFLTGFNARLAIVGYPTIMKELNTDIWKMIWIIQGYMLGSTIVQLILGALADYKGRVRFFIMGTIIFTMGSLVAGISINSLMLIIARIIQGIGAAFMMSLSITILTDNLPANRLATWLGVNQTAWRAGALLGLSVSGLLIDNLGWRSIFLIQIPFGIVVFMLQRKRLKETYVNMKEINIDYMSLFLFTSVITTSLLGLTLSGYGYTNLSKHFFITSVLLIIIIIVSKTGKSANHSSSLLIKNWVFTSSIITQFLYAIGFGATTLLFSLLLEVVHQLSPTKTGILLMPFEMSFLVFGLIGGKLSDIYGREAMASVGLSISALSLFLLSKPNISSNIDDIVVLQILYGVGTGLFVAPNTSLIMTSVPPNKRGLASSIRSLSFNVGFLLSLNIAVFSMTSVIPYSEATKLIAGLSQSNIYSLSDMLQSLCKAIKDLSYILIMAFLISLIRLNFEKGGISGRQN